MQILAIVIGAVASFIIGSIPDGVIVGKLYGGIDIRKHGSGNIGTTNAIRQMGWGGGLTVMVMDMLKGFIGTLVMFLLLRFMAGISYGFMYELGMSLSLLAAVCGHVFSPWLGFKGGKGIATAFGAFWLVCPWCGVTTIVAFAIGTLATKRVSVGSLAGDAAYFVTTLVVYNWSVPMVVVAFIVAALVLWAHRENVVRLKNGTENKFHAGSKETMEEAREQERREKAEAGAEQAEAEAEAEKAE